MGVRGKGKLLVRAEHEADVEHLSKGPGAQKPNLQHTSPWVPYLGLASGHTEGWCYAPDTVSCPEHMDSDILSNALPRPPWNDRCGEGQKAGHRGTSI